jgi:hypothetical protein
VGRIAGRNAAIYLGATTSAAASPLSFQNKWSIKFTSDKIDVTCFGDANKNYVAGLPDAQGDLSGFFDDASAQTYPAATDGLSRKFYLYPSSNTPTVYFFGTVLADLSIDGSVAGAVEVSASWSAATQIQRVPAT